MSLFRRLLVPLDGSAASEAVLPQVRRLLRGEDAELVFARAVPRESGDAPERARRHLSAIAARYAARGVRVRWRCEEGAPVATLLRIALEEACTMIVLARRGRGGFSRAVQGSIAEGLIRRSPLPVLACRAGEPGRFVPEPGPVRTLLVPLDGSPDDLAAMAAALELRRGFGSRLVLIQAVKARVTREDLRYVEALSHGAEGDGLPIFHRVVRGNPVERVLGAALHQHADLIVMATHGRRGLARLLGGSVAERILRESPVPVVSVRVAGTHRTDVA